MSAEKCKPIILSWTTSVCHVADPLPCVIFQSFQWPLHETFDVTSHADPPNTRLDAVPPAADESTLVSILLADIVSSLKKYSQFNSLNQPSENSPNWLRHLTDNIRLAFGMCTGIRITWPSWRCSLLADNRRSFLEYFCNSLVSVRDIIAL